MELFGLLKPFNEELGSLLAVDLEEVGVEVGRVRHLGLTTPSPRVLVIDLADEPLVRLVTVHFKLSGQGCLHGSLE